MPRLTRSLVCDVGRLVYETAGSDPLRPPEGGCAELAAAVLGPRAIRLVYGTRVDASLTPISSAGRMILLRAGQTPERVNWVIGHELAHWVLDPIDWVAVLTHSAREGLCDRVGAWLCAPGPAVREMGGATLAELAARYTITETSAAMRLAEEELTSGVDVVTPTRVHRRGAVPWTLTQARAKVLKRAPSGAIRLEIGDEPGRAALLPKRTG